jgi:hypothetical protein
MMLFVVFLTMVFLFSLVSRRAEEPVITGPMVLAHGVSTEPAIKLYARQVADLGPSAPEYA